MTQRRNLVAHCLQAHHRPLVVARLGFLEGEYVDLLPLHEGLDLVDPGADGVHVPGSNAHAPSLGGLGWTAVRAVDSPPVALTIGIVGLPNGGKSTLFNALTKNDVLAADDPFATIEPNVGVVALPEPRLARLAEAFDSARVVPATGSFVDIAGIVRGASKGEGLGNQFLANIREADAICQVIRAFHDPDVVHVDGEVSPGADIETINTELILADLQTLERAIPRYEKEVKGRRADAA